MDVGSIRVLPACCCTCCCLWSIFTFVALLVSFISLEQGQFALHLNWTTQKIAADVLTDPGMKFVGLGNMLKTFPSTFQTMYFVADGKGTGGDAGEVKRGPVKTRSQDGLEMSVSVSFQWKLDASSLHGLYTILGDSLYKDEFVRFARGAIVKSCADFPADMFFTNRTLITQNMLDNMIAAFNRPDQNLRVGIKGLQLREVDLPDAFDDEIGRTQEEMQEVEVAAAQRLELQIEMDQKIIEAEEKVNKLVLEGQADANALLSVNRAEVDQIINWQKQQAQANSAILKVFEDDNDPFARLFEIMEIWAMNQHDTDNLVVNM
eukprot:TRINITY_DN58262_c0_g1_i1.p1 TRINITY_DN58262_c0_g1~~TRINITY_DN58262_c0_g1_i1.p1  ORF type:complete len:355 (+),score=55.57 TRINITY_DN58262_c0_g1_i1:107-1066(+)